MAFASGQVLTATDMNRITVPMWVVASTSGSTSASADTIAATSPSTTYKAGRAYKLEFRGIINGATSLTKAVLSVRDTNTAGTVRMLEYGVDVRVSGNNYGFSGYHYVANTGGADIVGRVLVLITTGVGGNVQINAGAQIPRFFACYDAGLATDHPEAVAL